MTLDLNTAAETFASSTDFTVGLEEEFAILDAASLDLVPRFEELRDLAAAEDPVLSEAIAGELISSEIEIRSGRGEDIHDALRRQRDAREQRGVLRGRGVAQLLEARDEVERLRIEQRELLLQADGHVRRRREDLLRAVEVDGHGGPFEPGAEGFYVR